MYRLMDLCKENTFEFKFIFSLFVVKINIFIYLNWESFSANKTSTWDYSEFDSEETFCTSSNSISNLNPELVMVK